MKEITTIKVTKATHSLINAVRKDNETFSDAIERIVKSGVIIYG